jgi:hypothetical protein
LSLEKELATLRNTLAYLRQNTPHDFTTPLEAFAELDQKEALILLAYQVAHLTQTVLRLHRTIDAEIADGDFVVNPQPRKPQ